MEIFHCFWKYSDWDLSSELQNRASNSSGKVDFLESLSPVFFHITGLGSLDVL